MEARHIMTREIITVSPSMTVKNLATTLIKNQISGAPVADKNGKIIGVERWFFENGTLRFEEEHDRAGAAHGRQRFFHPNGRLERDAERLGADAGAELRHQAGPDFFMVP